MKVGYILFVLAAVYAILRPDDTTVVANWLGVDRGTDLMAYALIIAFVFTTLSTYMRFKDLELRYTSWPARSRSQCPGPRGALGCRKKATVRATPSSRSPSDASRAPSRPG